MDDAVNGRRRYVAPRRTAGALATRRTILSSARVLFVERGYVATTLADVARHAEVAVDTIYATIGPKPALLRAVFETSLSGTDAAVEAQDRSYVQKIRAAGSAAEKLGTYATALIEINARAGPISLVLAEAAKTDPACAVLRAELYERRAANMLRFAADLRGTGELRDDLSDQHVADILWATNAAEFWSLLTDERQWTAQQVGTWLTDAWIRLLLITNGPRRS